jgi:hypothetical protein
MKGSLYHFDPSSQVAYDKIMINLSITYFIFDQVPEIRSNITLTALYIVIIHVTSTLNLKTTTFFFPIKRLHFDRNLHLLQPHIFYFSKMGA